MFKAAIFDLDGLMIDSEPIWREVESAVFSARGAPVSIAECAQTMGLRVDEVVHFWQQRFPKASLDIGETQAEIIEGVIKLVEARGEPMPGVMGAIDLIRSMGLKLGLASSSSMAIIEAALRRFDLSGAFDAVCSAEMERRGKPAPDVYLSAIARLGIAPGEGVAFEDSFNGVESARAAGLVCVCVPDRMADRARLRANLLLNSLEELSAETILKLNDKR